MRVSAGRSTTSRPRGPPPLSRVPRPPAAAVPLCPLCYYCVSKLAIHTLERARARPPARPYTFLARRHAVNPSIRPILIPVFFHTGQSSYGTHAARNTIMPTTIMQRGVSCPTIYYFSPRPTPGRSSDDNRDDGVFPRTARHSAGTISAVAPYPPTVGPHNNTRRSATIDDSVLFRLSARKYHTESPPGLRAPTARPFGSSPGFRAVLNTQKNGTTTRSLVRELLR